METNKKVAIVDKCPSNTKYEQLFTFPFDLYHLSSVRLQKVLKKDVDLEFDPSEYDYIVLVGSEACKHIAGISSVTELSGHLVKEKFIPLTNPAILVFKPEGKGEFDKAVEKINGYISKGQLPAVATVDYKILEDEQEILVWLNELIASKPKYVCWDTEGTGLDPREGHILGVSLCYKPRSGVYIISDFITEEITEKLQYIAKYFKVVMHNSKYDVKMIEYHLAVYFTEDNVDDTMNLHYLLDEQPGTHGLKTLALKYTDFGDYDQELEEYKAQYCARHGLLKEDFTYDLVPIDILGKYAVIDVCVTYEIYEKFYPIVVKSLQLNKAYTKILIPGTRFLTNMEEYGIPFCKKRLDFAQKYLAQEILEAKQELHKLPEIAEFEAIQNKEFNPNSTPQLRALLFDMLGLESPGKMTKTGSLSTDAEVLEELAEQHSVPREILKLRKALKLKSTYVDNILAGLHGDNRIRTNFNLVFTTSGRLSSSGKFNAQTLPRDNPLIKGCIKSEPGYVILSQDLTTAEMYYAAFLSGDKNLQRVFIERGDFHSSIAKMVFGLPCSVEEVKKNYPLLRQAAKAISFGILYGSGPKKVADTVNKDSETEFSLDDAKDAINDYFTKFSKLKEWLESQRSFIGTNGYTYSFFGRKRRLKNVFSADKAIASHEVRSGVNFLVQSIASDVNLLGAITAQKEFNRLGMDAHCFALIHDAILVHVKQEQAEQARIILQESTQQDLGCTIPGAPIGVDSTISEDYSEGKFIKVYGEKFNEYLSN